MPKTYRLKIRTTVEAIQLKTAEDCIRAVTWCAGVLLEETVSYSPLMYRVFGLSVPTLEGVQTAWLNKKDYVVKNGSFKVKSAEEFEADYELV